MASIAIDKDGVCVDLTKKVLKFLSNTYPSRADEFTLENVKRFRFEENFPGVRDAVDRYFNSDEAFRNLELIEGSIEAIEELHRMGHEVFLCTAPIQNPNCFYNKADWFFNNLPFLGNRIVITHDKTIINADYLIDDHPDIVGINNKPSWKHILFNQPWNQYKKDGYYMRADGWKSILDYFWEVDK